MAINLHDTSDEVLQYLYSTSACLRTEVQEHCEKIFGRQSGVNSLSSMSQLVLDDLIEKTGSDFHITPAGEEIMIKYGSYSAYKKTVDEKINAAKALAPAQLNDISKNTVDRKTIAFWTVVLLVAAVAGIIFTALHHKG